MFELKLFNKVKVIMFLALWYSEILLFPARISDVEVKFKIPVSSHKICQMHDQQKLHNRKCLNSIIYPTHSRMRMK